MLALIQRKKGASKNRNCQKMKGYEHYKLGIFIKFCNTEENSNSSLGSFIWHGKFGQNFVGGSIKVTKMPF